MLEKSDVESITVAPRTRQHLDFEDLLNYYSNKDPVSTLDRSYTIQSLNNFININRGDISEFMLEEFGSIQYKTLTVKQAYQIGYILYALSAYRAQPKKPLLSFIIPKPDEIQEKHIPLTTILTYVNTILCYFIVLIYANYNKNLAEDKNSTNPFGTHLILDMSYFYFLLMCFCLAQEYLLTKYPTYSLENVQYQLTSEKFEPAEQYIKWLQTLKNNVEGLDDRLLNLSEQEKIQNQNRAKSLKLETPAGILITLLCVCVACVEFAPILFPALVLTKLYSDLQDTYKSESKVKLCRNVSFHLFALGIYALAFKGVFESAWLDKIINDNTVIFPEHYKVSVASNSAGLAWALWFQLFNSASTCVPMMKQATKYISFFRQNQAEDTGSQSILLHHDDGESHKNYSINLQNLSSTQ